MLNKFQDLKLKIVGGNGITEKWEWTIKRQQRLFNGGTVKEHIRDLTTQRKN